MATIKDVAKTAGVSIASASRVLNGHPHVTKGMRERVERAVRELNYVPHGSARSLSLRRTDAIGVILPDLFGDYFSELVRGIDSVAHAAGFQLLLSNVHGTIGGTIQAMRTMRGRVDGLLVMVPEGDPAQLATALTAALPTVLLDYGAPIGDAPGLALGNYEGARMMTEALLARGYRRIAHVSGPRGNRDAADRQRGFCDAMREVGGEHAPIIIAGEFTEEGGRDAARLLLSCNAMPEAIFAANDISAIGCMEVFKQAGLTIPDDIAIAGFDGIPLARLVTPQLSTVETNIAELGATAMQTLLRMLDKSGECSVPSANLPPPTLRMRGSIGFARGHAGQSSKTDDKSDAALR